MTGAPVGARTGRSVSGSAFRTLARKLLVTGIAQAHPGCSKRPTELTMFALTLLHTLDRVRHEVLVPAWYWGLAICDGAAYLLARR